MIRNCYTPEPELFILGSPACMVAVLHHLKLRLSEVLVLPQKAHACLSCLAVSSEVSSAVPNWTVGHIRWRWPVVR